VFIVYFADQADTQIQYIFSFIMTTDDRELDDIKTQFSLIIENYPEVYANFKLNPHLPSAMSAHDKMESNLTALYRRMFAHQAAVDKQLEEHESGLNHLTNENSKLNTTLAKREMSLASTKTIMPNRMPMPLKESFDTITGLAENDAPTPVQISIVDDAKNIEKSVYYYSIARIIYLLVGIGIVSYFIFQTIGAPESTVLADAKNKVSQLKDTVIRPTPSNQYNPYNP
jgi:hypothetical protein